MTHWKTWDLKSAFQHYSNIHPMLKEEGKKKKKLPHTQPKLPHLLSKKKTSARFVLEKNLSQVQSKRKELPHIPY